MRTVVLYAVLILALTGCSSTQPESPGSRYPGTQDGARQLVTDLRTGDPLPLIKTLVPTAEDCRAVFEGELAAKAEAYYGKQFATPETGPIAKPDQTELELWAASSEDLKAKAGNFVHFPGGYAKIAPSLKPGLTFYRWKYVVPGSDLGMAYDGLVYLGSRWVWLPKPWRPAESA
ncbi:hypothetical protein ACFWMR_25190 [Amycolatopsis thailandensis]|uniref:hypothetical protein n=1 Tax=Amycolatopsis thailandensis TaxID=589330 RepID=UPI001177DC93|nr:hypothetical protein [Amycolatopsis thailandensis]